LKLGTAVITAKEALLWTDGRYFAQAEKELDKTSWTLMRDGTKDVLSITNWLARVKISLLLFHFI
jgi:Xaa-Pro aminopeptidase